MRRWGVKARAAMALTVVVLGIALACITWLAASGDSRRCHLVCLGTTNEVSGQRVGVFALTNFFSAELWFHVASESRTNGVWPSQSGNAGVGQKHPRHIAKAGAVGTFTLPAPTDGSAWRPLLYCYRQPTLREKLLLNLRDQLNGLKFTSLANRITAKRGEIFLIIGSEVNE